MYNNTLLQDRALEVQCIKELTKRQLFSDYRKTVKHYNDVVTHYNTGSEWHLGEPIRRVVANAQFSLKAIMNEFVARDIEPTDIKNVDELVIKLTQTQLEQQADSKALQQRESAQRANDERIAKEQEPLIEAMNKLCVFALNYNYNFIEQAFAHTHLVDHFKSKFLGYYDKCTPYGALIAFAASLDTENKDALMRYILKSDIR